MKPTAQTNFDHDKFKAFFEAQKAKLSTQDTSTPSTGASKNSSHLDALHSALHRLTGGIVSIPGVGSARPGGENLTGKTICLVFDSVLSSVPDDKGTLERSFTGMSDIRKLVTGNEEFITSFSKRAGVVIPEGKEKEYCTHVSQSSRAFVEASMEWLVKESGINTQSYLAEIANSEKKRDDGKDLTVFDEIRLASTFKQKLVESASVSAPTKIRGDGVHSTSSSKNNSGRNSPEQQQAELVGGKKPETVLKGGGAATPLTERLVNIPFPS